LGVPYFAGHIRQLTERFDSQLADVGNPLVARIGRHIRWPRVGPNPWQGDRRNYCPPWLRFSVIFLGCKANARVQI
jgi:hypothetical protein